MFGLEVGKSVADTVAVVITVRTSGLIGVPGGVRGDKEGLGRKWGGGGWTIPECVGVSGEDVCYEDRTGADDFFTFLSLVVVII